MSNIEIDKESAEHEMRLGKKEFYAMNNPVRRFIQKYGEFRVFKNFLGSYFRSYLCVKE